MAAFKPYVQDVDDWINFYAKGNTSHNKNSGETIGGIGGESGNTANPVERSVPNNLKVLDTKMRQGELSSMAGQEVVQQALARTVRRRRRKRKPVRRLKRKKKTKKRKRKGNGKHKSKKKRKRRKQRDLFG
jgi:hypothetical protein